MSNSNQSHDHDAGGSQGSNEEQVSDISDFSIHDDTSQSHIRSRDSCEEESITAMDERQQLELAGFSAHGMSGADMICGRTSGTRSRRPSETSRTSSGVRIVGNMQRIQSDMPRTSSMRVDPENWLSRRTGSFSQLSSNLSIPTGHGGSVTHQLRSSQTGGEQPLTRENAFSPLHDQSEETAYYPNLPKGQGFTVMYQDAVSRRIAAGSSLYHVRSNTGRFRNRSPSHSSQQSEDTSRVSPYYEPNGSWLRLRPQSHANFTYRSRLLQRQSQSVESYLPQQMQERRYLQYNYANNNTSLPVLEGEEFSAPEGSDPQMLVNVESNATPALLEESDESFVNIPATIENEEEVLNDCHEKETDEESNPEFKPIEPHIQVSNTSMTLDRGYMTTQEGTRDSAENQMMLIHDANNVEVEHTPVSAHQRNAAHRNSQALSASDDLQWASTDSKYDRYHCRVDREQGDKAVEIPLFLFQRPHMRGFHFAWMSFFVAFFTWFALAPLLGEIKNSLQLSHEQVWMSNVFSSAGTVVCRIIAGPLCDRFGARFIMAATLVVAAIPVLATGLVYSAVELYMIRLVTGVAGASFVVSQYWTSCMFTREIAGTANSLVAGWGNLGGGLTQLVMGSALFPLFKFIYSGSSDDEQEVADRAWRTVFIVPALLSFIMAILVMKYSDDSPKGNYRKLKRLGLMPKVQAMKALREASSDINTWLLFVHYGCCFGVEVTMTAGLALYFREEFEQSTESAAAIASIFGWMNLFARGLGGFISDIMNVKSGMRGRLLWQFLSMVAEGATVIAFSYVKSIAGAIGMMVLFSLFVQSTEGSTYSIIPYVCPAATGSVSGIVGAGGNVGGVIFLLMIQKWHYRTAFKLMGVCVLCSSLLSFFIVLKGHAGLICGSDANEVMEIRRNQDLEADERKHEEAEQPSGHSDGFTCIDVNTRAQH